VKGLVRRLTWLVVGVVVAVVAVLVVDHVRSHRDPSQVAIPGEVPELPTGPPFTPGSIDAPYVAGISDNGRYFVDQNGDPFLVRGDSPWSMLADLRPEEFDGYWGDRAARGFNAAIVSLIGDGGNGGTWDGATADGILPFLGGDPGRVSTPNPDYLARAHDLVESAGEFGITVFLYPVDGWVVGHAFRPESTDECAGWGRVVAQTFADLPNIVWGFGGDYVSQDPPTDTDRCFDAVRVGLRAEGDTRPVSIQFMSPLTWSTQNEYWSSRVDWNFVYSYAPTFQGVREAWATEPPRPVLLGESNYEGLNLQPDSPPTTNESLRRQVAWALTSGAAGDFYGSQDWEFRPGWQDRIDRPGQAQVNTIRDVFERLPWWTLRPADDQEILLGGPPAGDDPNRDVLEDDHPTVAVTDDGALAVAYLPAAMTVSVEGDFTDARWVDPSTGDEHLVDPSWRDTRTLTTPGGNADDGEDWLLILSHT